jgi:hypothetical protein
MAIGAIRGFGYNGKIQIVANPKENWVNVEKLRSFYEKMGLEVFSYYGERSEDTPQGTKEVKQAQRPTRKGCNG